MAKGQKTGGRTKGTPNKATAAVREALLIGFDKVGGMKAFTAWGKENQTEFYKLWAKLLPQEVHAEHTNPDGSLRFTIRVGDAPGSNS